MRLANDTADGSSETAVLCPIQNDLGNGQLAGQRFAACLKVDGAGEAFVTGVLRLKVIVLLNELQERSSWGSRNFYRLRNRFDLRLFGFGKRGFRRCVGESLSGIKAHHCNHNGGEKRGSGRAARHDRHKLRERAVDRSVGGGGTLCAAGRSRPSTLLPKIKRRQTGADDWLGQELSSCF